MFADSDFILAIIKESDWLKDKAQRILKKYGGNITASISVMIEIALLCKKMNKDVMENFINIFEFIDVDKETYDISLKAAVYIEEDGFNVFDAFHAAYCSGDTIISSDDVYDRIGMKKS